MGSTISSRPRSSSLVDRASVRGVKKGRKNRRRRREEAPSHRRLLVVCGRSAAVVAIAGVLVFGGEQIERYAKTSETFAIERIVVRGNERASEESVVRLSGLAVGNNVFEANVEEIAKTVEAHPWIERASVSRRLPREVEIEVIEHVPVVLVALDHLYYANAEGDIVKRYTPGERETLPVVTGLSREQIETDEGESRAQLLLALRFLSDLEAALGTDAPEVAEVHVGGAVGLSFVAAEDETRVVVGHPPWADRIGRIASTRRVLADRNVSATRIMLDGRRRPDRAVARLAAGQQE